MPATYEPIQSYTVSGSSTNTLTWNSIPQTYTDLVIIGSGGYTFADTLVTMKINNDSSALYTYQALEYNTNNSGPAIGSRTGSSETNAYVGWYAYPRSAGEAAGDTSNLIIHFMNYTNTTTFKSMLNRNNTVYGNSGAKGEAILYRSTSAITRIDLFFNAYGSPNFSNGSQYTLYGIKAA